MAVPTPRLESIEEEARRYRRRAEEERRRREEEERRARIVGTVGRVLEMRPKAAQPQPPPTATPTPTPRPPTEPAVNRLARARERLEAAHQRMAGMVERVQAIREAQVARTPPKEEFGVTLPGAMAMPTPTGLMQRSLAAQPAFQMPSVESAVIRAIRQMPVSDNEKRRLTAQALASGLVSPARAERELQFPGMGVQAVPAKTLTRGPAPFPLPAPGETATYPTVMQTEPTGIWGRMWEGRRWLAEKTQVPEQLEEAFYAATMAGPGGLASEATASRGLRQLEAAVARTAYPEGVPAAGRVVAAPGVRPTEAAARALDADEVVTLRELRALQEQGNLNDAGKRALAQLEAREAVTAPETLGMPEERLLGEAAGPEATPFEWEQVAPELGGPTGAARALPTVEESISRFNTNMRAFTGPQVEYAENKAAALRQRAAQLDAIVRSRKYPTDAKDRIMMGVMRGWGENRPDISRGWLFSEDITNLRTVIDLSEKGTAFDKFNARQALNKAAAAMASGNRKLLPTRGETARLAQFLGPEVGDAIEVSRAMSDKAFNFLMEVWNAPRTLRASFDLSAPLRQGWMLGPGHPKEFLAAARAMFKYAVSEEAIQASEEAMRADPLFATFQAAKVPLSITERFGPMVGREEVFQSRLFQMLGKLGIGFRASERGYTGFLNDLRWGVAKTMYRSLEDRGYQMTDDLVNSISRYVNVASGRGELGPLEQYAPLLGGPFFALRWAISRYQMPYAFLTAHPTVRWMIARDMAAWAGTNLALATMLKLSGAADLEIDPRSTDFAKIRVGPLRVDLWAGEQQVIRGLAQMITGRRKSTATGEIYPADWRLTGVRTVTGKFQPWAALALASITGETYLGEEMEPTLPIAAKQFRNLVLPMFMEDVIDATNEMGWQGGLIAAAPSFFGASTLAYRTAGQRLEIARDAASMDKYDKKFQELVDEGAPDKGVKPGYASALMAIEDHPAVIEGNLQYEKEKSRYGGWPNLMDWLADLSAEQEAANESLPNPREWVPDYLRRRDDRSALIAKFYAENPDTAERRMEERAELLEGIGVFALPEDAGADVIVAAEESIYAKYKSPAGEITDRDALYTELDRFTGNLTPEQQAILDAQRGLMATDKEREYQVDTRRIQQEWDWFDRFELAWSSAFVGEPPLPYYTTVTPEGEKIIGHAENLRQMMDTGGLTETEAYEMMGRNRPDLADQLEAFRKATNSQKPETNPFLRVRRDNPELDYLLYKQGRTDTVMSTEAWLLWWENYGQKLGIRPRFHQSVKDELMKRLGPWQLGWVGS